MARREIADIHAAGRTPILVGGTGLYLRTLLDGIAPVPAIDPDVRRAGARSRTVEENRAEARDASTRRRPTRLKPADTARIDRALEVILSTGRTLGEWQAQREGGIADEVELRPLILLPPRKWLYARCDERFARDGRARRGGRGRGAARAQAQPEPAGDARDRGAGDRRPICCGEQTLDEAIAAGQQATRRYAKRQYTWFAHQPPADWPRFKEALDVGPCSAKRWPCFGGEAA